MKIGVDISPLQSPHRMRGIGATIINVVNSFAKIDTGDHHFIFYLFEGDDDPLELLQIKNLSYETRYIPDAPRKPSISSRRLLIPLKAVRSFRKLVSYSLGDDRVSSDDNLDAFLQFEQDKQLPKGRGFKKYLVVYDIIPYVLEKDYLYSYSTARHKGHSRKGSILKAYHRWLYMHKLRVNSRRADRLLAISDLTKKDFIETVGASSKKIATTSLGIYPVNASGKKSFDDLSCGYYVNTSWGYIKKPYILTSNEPFLLFVGGVDKRRKLSDVVDAFNHLRAEGVELKLVLAGDILVGPECIPVPETRDSLEDSSYKNDIIFMGFVSEDIREELYARALAFVYPSIYEGFGLPVLEAMSYGCPVICYKNDAVYEVAKDYPFYANGPEDIHDITKKIILKKPSLEAKGKMAKFANSHTWTKTAQKILDNLEA